MIVVRVHLFSNRADDMEKKKKVKEEVKPVRKTKKAAVETDKVREIRLELPTFFKNELVAEATVRQIAELSGFSEEQIEEIETALGEACINAIEHSKVKEMKIHISFIPKDSYLSIIVEDRGVGFNPDDMATPKISEKMKSMYKRGWGLMLIERLMDEIVFDESFTEGTRLSMKKYLEKKRKEVLKETDDN
jgi:serine/threonine-protein kinase RsbW